MDDTAYLRIPAPGQRILITSGPWKDTAGTVKYVSFGNVNWPHRVRLDVEVFPETTVWFDVDSVQPLGTDPAFILLPRQDDSSPR